jgi:hypothetical protein
VPRPRASVAGNHLCGCLKQEAEEGEGRRGEERRELERIVKDSIVKVASLTHIKITRDLVSRVQSV